MYSAGDVDLYELEHEDFDGDLDMYRSYALSTGGPVLELGCGTGRALLPLARAGLQVVGVDSSAAMLERARTKLEAAAARHWKLVRSDLSDLSRLPAEHFGLAFCALNTWSHLTSSNDALRALESVHRVLRPAGLLIIDLEDPEQRTQGRGELVLAGVFPDGDDTVMKMVVTVSDPAQGVEDLTVIWDRINLAGGMHRTLSQTRMRLCHRWEMEQMLERTHFATEDVFGSWELDAYTGRGDRLIFVAASR